MAKRYTGIQEDEIYKYIIVIYVTLCNMRIKSKCKKYVSIHGEAAYSNVCMYVCNWWVVCVCMHSICVHVIQVWRPYLCAYFDQRLITDPQPCGADMNGVYRSARNHTASFRSSLGSRVSPRPSRGTPLGWRLRLGAPPP